MKYPLPQLMQTQTTLDAGLRLGDIVLVQDTPVRIVGGRFMTDAELIDRDRIQEVFDRYYRIGF